MLVFTRPGDSVNRLLQSRIEFGFRCSGFRVSWFQGPKVRAVTRVDQGCNIEALIIRIGRWGILYYKYNKEPVQKTIGNYKGPLWLLAQNPEP